MKRNKKLSILVILLTLLLSMLILGCNKKGISLNEYLDWFSKKDCPMSQKQEIDGYIFELHYLTADYLALSEFKNTKINKKKLKKELNDRNGLFYFLLRITPPQEKLNKFREEESKSINWFSFGIKEDIKVILNKDTLHCMISEFEASMGILPYQSFNIGINKPNSNTINPSSDIEFIFMDRVNSEKQIHFKFKSSDFKQIPTYKL